MHIRAEQGALRAGGRLVVTLKDGEGEYSGGALTMSAAAAVVNAVWLANAPRLDLELCAGKRRWRWQGVTAGVAGGKASIIAQGAPEVI
jgi:hypothetical protein